MTKERKILLIVLTTIVFIRILYIIIGGEVDKNYYTSYEINAANAAEFPCTNLTQEFSGKGGRLHSIEMIFTGISDDKIGNITMQITSGEDLIYQTDIALININNSEWKKVYINAELDSKKIYKLHLTTSNNCVHMPNVLITTAENASPEALHSYFENDLIDGQIAIKYGYLQAPGIFERLVISSIWILGLLILYSIILNYEKIACCIKTFNECFEGVNRDSLFIIIEVFACLIVVNCSGIEFQNSTKILLYAISVCAAVKLNRKREMVNKIANTIGKKIMLLILYLYAGFSLVGQRILVYPLTLKVNLAGLFVLAITTLWFVPVIQTLFTILEQLSLNAFSENKKNKTSFVIVSILFLLTPAIFNLYANNPGISSQDTIITMITNAHNLYGMTDWHPAFYCIILNMILSVWDSTYAIIIVQYIFWSYVFVELFLYLRKKGMKDSVIFTVAFLSGINAANFLHLNTIWKDIPYAISVLWVVIILAKISIDFEEYKKKWYIYLKLIIALTGVYFYKKNGIATFAFIVVFMMVILRRNIKMWCTLVVTIVLIFTIKGPIYSHFAVQDLGTYGMYVGLGQDILGAYYGGGEVSNDTLSMISAMTGYNSAEYKYNPTWAGQSLDVDVGIGEFIANYVDTFFKNPILMLRAIIDRQNVVWDINLGQDTMMGCVNFYATADGIELLWDFDESETIWRWNDYYPVRKYNSLYDRMSKATDWTASTQWVAAVEWRCGLFTLLGLSAFSFTIIKYGFKKYILIMAPIIGHILSLALSSGWSDFRYFWPLNLMNLASILLLLVVAKAMNENANMYD